MAGAASRRSLPYFPPPLSVCNQLSVLLRSLSSPLVLSVPSLENFCLLIPICFSPFPRPGPLLSNTKLVLTSPPSPSSDNVQLSAEHREREINRVASVARESRKLTFFSSFPLAPLRFLLFRSSLSLARSPTALATMTNAKRRARSPSSDVEEGAPSSAPFKVLEVPKEVLALIVEFAALGE